ncbi:hypothetical protein K491DRAFT_686168 [Lophiostoma macrostomum CBS 122681]|uniref:GCN5-related N-acetyltransferase Rv2170-like domain-containing protein n=1 Tax=Lophiostoma macrostomum CBS 122681 TaxID=1314788 RepID=A0A6A6TSF5_9PLEO|nr:hypothetical protein K491DRAFT_686168 [Lophiostoma macrostomum CBS 122681]
MALQVYEHPASSPVLQKALKQALPWSINLVYRTKHTNRTPDAHILSTFPEDAQSIPRCWAAAYLDRSMRPETELWLFASEMIPGHNDQESSFCSTCGKAVLVLFDHMSTLSLPPLRPDNEPAMRLAKQHEKEYPETGPQVRYPPDPGTYMRHLLTPSVVTLGACHDAIIKICDNAGLIRREFPGHDLPLNKFLFKVSDLPQTRELPEGLRWGEMREKDIDTVKARTSIPRTTQTLLSLKSVGVFEEHTDTPVAWTFLGLDGSLTTLHTEPQYRGKGIGKAVAAKIFRDYAPELAVDNEGSAWAHADVYKGNVQSEAVCGSLGGSALWTIFWVRVDLWKAGALAERTV